jgi:hypothetical protein
LFFYATGSGFTSRSCPKFSTILDPAAHRM